MVANEEGLRQVLPQAKKRDSVVEPTMESKFHLTPHEDGVKLEVPQSQVSRSSSPVLEAMSSRIAENGTDQPQVLNVPDDVPLLSMSARVTR